MCGSNLKAATPIIPSTPVASGAMPVRHPGSPGRRPPIAKYRAKDQQRACPHHERSTRHRRLYAEHPQQHSNASIIINDTGITISNGKGATITMTGSVIDFNNGALTIT